MPMEVRIESIRSPETGATDLKSIYFSKNKLMLVMVALVSQRQVDQIKTFDAKSDITRRIDVQSTSFTVGLWLKFSPLEK